MKAADLDLMHHQILFEGELWTIRDVVKGVVLAHADNTRSDGTVLVLEVLSKSLERAGGSLYFQVKPRSPGGVWSFKRGATKGISGRELFRGERDSRSATEPKSKE